MKSVLRATAAFAALATVLTGVPPPTLAAAGHSFLWKVTGKGGTVYLVGSVHLLPKDFYPLNPPLEAAYKDSDILVEEVDLAEMMAPEMQLSLLTRGQLSSSESLDKILAPATMEALKKRLDSLGAIAGPLMRLRPWLLALMVDSLEWQKKGFDPNFGLDKHFYDQAVEDKKSVKGLETVNDQISIFENMSPQQQDHLLAETLTDIDTEQANMAKMIDAWRVGDAPAVEKIVLADIQKESDLYQRLLVNRNKNWMPKIEELFARRGHALVVVGAAHLVGPDGLLAMLRAKGYTIEQP
jgi:uncharacterized protein YbaP (TraB family)